jgi:UDP-glucuronate 4-epimerase
VVGLDNINDYYDVNLKYNRLKETGIAREQIQANKLLQSSIFPGYRFIRMNLEDKEAMMQLFKEECFDYVINLAAQAGVRYSIDNPDVYIQSNVIGFFNVLEACRHYPVKHLLFASSSSVYGNNTKVPFSETDNVDHPISLYAATKKSNELIAHAYSHLYNIPVTGLRFFTVYGPWGRPDMAMVKFTKAILEGKPIQVFNHGELYRDFTYVDDIVAGITQYLDNFSPNADAVNYCILNIGNNSPVKLLDFIMEIELYLGKTAEKQLFPMQAGDVLTTYADISKIQELCDFRPQTNIKEGISKFCDWYQGYYK